MAYNKDKEPVPFKIIEHIGVLSEGSSGWQKEINLVSWNNKEPKYDVRDWAPDHAKMGKGITLDADEAHMLLEYLSNIKEVC
jgi:hypothetical protein